jgi:hypothetical protein
MYTPSHPGVPSQLFDFARLRLAARALRALAA